MLYVAHFNEDNTISVKNTEKDTTTHYTREQLAQISVPILGVYRNIAGEILQIRPIEANSVSEGLLPVINLIETPEIQSFANMIRRIIPKYFFEVAASSSGKYHPASNLGYGGLLRHTIFVCENLKHITEIESTQQLFNLTQEQIDLMIVACMMHDAFKQGFDKNLADYDQHPNTSANVMRSLVGFLPQDKLEFIAKCIETHMGQWNYDHYGNVILRKPQTVYEWMVHLADYMASRPNISITLNNTVYYKTGETVECTNKIMDKLSANDLLLIQSAMTKANTKSISKSLKDKYEIVREDEEIKKIWENIVTYGNASDKQKKYVSLAKEFVK